MADLSSSLTVSFNEDEPEKDEAPDDLLKNYSFVLEEDKGGADLFRPCSAYIQVEAGVKQIFKQSGIVNVRLYSPKSASVKIYGTYGGSIKPLGIRQDIIYETLTFAGSKRQALSKGYGIASGTVLDSTAFYSKEGSSIKTKEESEDESFKAVGSGKPSQIEKGLYESSKEVYGAMMVSYSPLYRLYRVEYNIPTSVIEDMAATGKSISEYSLLPITVLAFASGGYGATLNLSRNFNTQVTQQECSGHWVEEPGARKTKDIKVYDPDDLDGDGNPKPGANWIGTEAIIELVEFCSNDPETKRIRRFIAPE